MPCYDARPEGEARECHKSLKAERLRLDAITRVACELAAAVRSVPGKWDTLTEVTRQWVEKHDEWDARRKARGEA